MFKYQVAEELHHQELRKAEDVIDDPLARTSAVFMGLSISTIWEWEKQRAALRASLIHGANYRYNKNRQGGIGCLKTRETCKLTLHKGGVFLSSLLMPNLRS